jgi:hypothetical protein
MAYLPLSTANLPDPAIDPAQGSSPQDYFAPAIYTGNGSTQSIDVGFATDFVWAKSRSAAINHRLFDQVRGVRNKLMSNSTAAEEDEGGVTAFNSDGFSLGSDGGINTNGATYVAWNWKANGSGVSNTDGSITSTVSANTESGFSIVSYTGTGSAATVGHGLDSAPEMVIVKNRTDGSRDWLVYHKSVGNTASVFLNLTSASVALSAYWNNTSPTSSVFSLGNSSAGNGSTDNLIAYCFHSVEGYSKFGSYTGNGSDDGTFVYTGFRPSWILFKRSDGGTHHWRMFDSTRSTFNDVDDYLTASSSVAEAVGKDVDFLSNGFKLRTTDSDVNLSGGTYIYACFSENPFKYSNAR